MLLPHLFSFLLTLYGASCSTSVELFRLTDKVQCFLKQDMDTFCTTDEEIMARYMERECAIEQNMVFLNKPGSTECFSYTDIFPNKEKTNFILDQANYGYKGAQHTFIKSEGLAENVTLGMVKGLHINDSEMNSLTEPGCTWAGETYVRVVKSPRCTINLPIGYVLGQSSKVHYSSKRTQVIQLLLNEVFTMSKGNGNVGLMMLFDGDVERKYQSSALLQIRYTAANDPRPYFTSQLTVNAEIIAFPVKDKVYNPTLNYESNYDYFSYLDRIQNNQGAYRKKRQTTLNCDIVGGDTKCAGKCKNCRQDLTVNGITFSMVDYASITPCSEAENSFLNAVNTAATLCREAQTDTDGYNSPISDYKEGSSEYTLPETWSKSNYFWVPAAVDFVAAGSLGSAFAATWRLAGDVTNFANGQAQYNLQVSQHINDIWDEISTSRGLEGQLFMRLQNVEYKVNSLHVGLRTVQVEVQRLKNQIKVSKKSDLIILNEALKPREVACNKTEIEEAFKASRNSTKKVKAITCRDGYAYITLVGDNGPLDYTGDKPLFGETATKLYGKYAIFTGDRNKVLNITDPVVSHTTTSLYMRWENVTDANRKLLLGYKKTLLYKACQENGYNCVTNLETPLTAESLYRDSSLDETHARLVNIGLNYTVEGNKNFYTLTCKETPGKNVTVKNYTRNEDGTTTVAEVNITVQSSQMCNKSYTAEQLIDASKEAASRHLNPYYPTQQAVDFSMKNLVDFVSDGAKGVVDFVGKAVKTAVKTAVKGLGMFDGVLGSIATMAIVALAVIGSFIGIFLLCKARSMLKGKTYGG